MAVVRLVGRWLGAVACLLMGTIASADPRPNIVLILADDLGFTDTAPYGSEINTPTLSMLADNGIIFSNYHTAASCAPSRAMLLTGVDSHRNGVPNIPEALPPEQRAYANYQGVLGRNVVTVASLLQESGYHTYMAGKWHLGQTPVLLPSQRGFERTVAMADTGSDNWEQKPYIPIYDKANWFADGQRYELPEDFYSSEFLIDKTIGFIDGGQGDGRPFFAYVPFMAVHIPVQAPQAFTDRYSESYVEGWDALRNSRHAAAIELGLVPGDSAKIEMTTTESWDDLSDERKRYNAKRMAVYAGMVEAMDFHIGRLVEYLRESGQLENTVFIFTSDNGAEPSGFVNPDTVVNRFIMEAQDYSIEYDTLGQKGSFSNIGASFASAAASPLAYYKFYAGEGGLRVPLILSGAGIEASDKPTNAFSFVTDITPTILELSGTPLPGKYSGGRAVEPIIGRSLMPVIEGKAVEVYSDDEPIGYELAGNAALFMGDHKVVMNRGPVGPGEWQLYNIVRDPGETMDLSEKQPQRLQEMLNLYEQYAALNNVLPVSEDYQQPRQILLNGLKERLGKPLVLLLLTLGVLIPFYIVMRIRAAMVQENG